MKFSRSDFEMQRFESRPPTVSNAYGIGSRSKCHEMAAFRPRPLTSEDAHATRNPAAGLGQAEARKTSLPTTRRPGTSTALRF